MHSNTILSVFLNLLSITTALTQSSLPQVDLGYEIHQAFSFNETLQTYNFSNIRFAQPPVGKLRFAVPQAPTGRNPVIQNGSFGPICPQALPVWSIIQNQYLVDLVAKNTSLFNFTLAEQELQAYLATATPSVDPRTTEDCLFLDVVVPKAVFEKASTRQPRSGARGAGAPVIVYIYGGGYVVGDKSDGIDSINPNGLIQASQSGGSDGVIWVAPNYRLGALGWLAGPSLQKSGGVSNAGLYDQHLAIEWVSQNIHKFGGDPNQVTLMGGSAGGGSIMHQITAYGGQQPVKFQQAVVQYPGFLPITSQFVQENTTQAFLSLLNVSTIEDARMASSEAVISANAQQVAFSPYGTFTYGPVVDGTFVPALPGLLLDEGAFAKNLSIIAAYNTNDGANFSPPYLLTTAAIANWFPTIFPSIQPSVIAYFVDVLYPATFDGSYGYTTPFSRICAIITEIFFACNTHFLATAFNNQTHNYEFEVPPAFHAADVPYVNYDGPRTGPAAATGLAPLALPLQQYLANFVETGNPNGPGLPYWPVEGNNGTLIGFNITGITVRKDSTASQRCEYVQLALYT